MVFISIVPPFCHCNIGANEDFSFWSFRLFSMIIFPILSVCSYCHLPQKPSTGEFNELTRNPTRDRKLWTSFTETIHQFVSPYNKNKNEVSLEFWNTIVYFLSPTIWYPIIIITYNLSFRTLLSVVSLDWGVLPTFRSKRTFYRTTTELLLSTTTRTALKKTQTPSMSGITTWGMRRRRRTTNLGSISVTRRFPWRNVTKIMAL